MRAVGNAHLPHSFSELFLAMLSPQTAYAQLNMCSVRSCLCSDPTSGQSHDRSVVAPYPLGAPVGRLAMCRVSRPPLHGTCHHSAGSAHPTNADSMSRPLTSASRAEASRLESSEVRA